VPGSTNSSNSSLLTMTRVSVPDPDEDRTIHSARILRPIEVTSWSHSPSIGDATIRVFADVAS
jgi:hypothetical protein